MREGAGLPASSTGGSLGSMLLGCGFMIVKMRWVDECGEGKQGREQMSRVYKGEDKGLRDPTSWNHVL